MSDVVGISGRIKIEWINGNGYHAKRDSNPVKCKLTNRQLLVNVCSFLSNELKKGPANFNESVVQSIFFPMRKKLRHFQTSSIVLPNVTVPWANRSSEKSKSITGSVRLHDCFHTSCFRFKLPSASMLCC